MTSQTTHTIHDLIHNAGAEHGDRIFLRYEENDVIYDVTYQDFTAQCDAISAWAAEKGEEIGHRIKAGLFGSSSHHYLAVLLGVMSQGAAAVPLDIQLNAETLADNLNRSDVDILFYDWEYHVLIDEIRSRCPNVREYISLQHGSHVPCSDKILKAYEGKSAVSQAGPEDNAMILFTSGTTGRGKGVMLSNRNLIDNTFCTTDLDHPEREIYLSVLPIHHVFCLNGDVFIVMRYGSTLCLNRSMSKLAAHILLFQPTVMRMVPMMAKSLYNRIAILNRQKPDQPLRRIKEEVLGKRLHKIISGGGYLAPELAANYSRLGIAISQGYGMSECSPKIASPDWSRPDKIDSVGRIVDGCQVRIVDDEIQVKSPSVMMGYYKDPERTAEAITEDGWLRTGDIGYVDEENFLYLTGRKKNLIILSNGENVAPEQLENLFEDERLIEDILVYGEDDTICAEVYPNLKYAEAANITDIPGTIDAIVKKYNQQLPSYKRILKCRVRETPFAKTSSKKIIRGQYFTEKKKEEERQADILRPENEMQERLYDCIAAVLGSQRFGIDTDLYEAGLDSLGSVLLLTDLHNTFKLSMTLDDLMNHASVRQLEQFAAGSRDRDQVDHTIREVYPLTNLQLYFAYVMRGNTTANLPFLFRLDQRVDLLRLKNSVVKLFDLHPELKDVIQFDDGAFKNFRDDRRPVKIDITRLSDDEWEKTRQGLLHPYLYGQGEPLYHMGIYQTDSANYFFLDIAHIMGDGMTMNILFEDLNALYVGKNVMPEDYTFYEYILDEKDKDARGLRTRNEEYFLELMKDFKIRKSILTRRDCRRLDWGEDAVIKRRFEGLSRKKVTAFCRENGVSENVLFLTAFNYCVGIFSNEKDTVSTTIHSGRTDSRWNRLAGPLFLTYYFRQGDVSGDTVEQMLKGAGKQIMDTMRCYISNLHADEMFFQYQGDILNINEIGGYPAERLKIQLDSLPFHMQVFWDEKGYFCELRYWENRFDRKQLFVFLAAMEAVLEAIPEEKLARRLVRRLPDILFPRHYFVEAGEVNHAAGSRLISDVGSGDLVKAYVLGPDCRKKPFGGWGDLYIMDHDVEGCVDTITNPYGPGILYRTGRTARILPDGTLDMLEQGGRTIMSEGLTGRHFLDLNKLEYYLSQYPGISRAEAYVRYAPGNRLVLTADLYGAEEPDTSRVSAYLAEHCEKPLLPEEIRFIKI